jgi:hypothetical protein
VGNEARFPGEFAPRRKAAQTVRARRLPEILSEANALSRRAAQNAYEKAFTGARGDGSIGWVQAKTVP